MALGHIGTLDATLGRLAVRLVVLPVLALAVLSSCRAIGDVSGVVAAAGVGSASANPAVGIAVGIAVRSGVNALVKYLVRKRHTGEQDAIAEAAGAATLGSSRAWEIRHVIPVGNTNGELVPVREMITKLATCREIVFTIVDGNEREVYTTTLCREGATWRWAGAEPAVARWGFLQ